MQFEIGDHCSVGQNGRIEINRYGSTMAIESENGSLQTSL